MESVGDGLRIELVDVCYVVWTDGGDSLRGACSYDGCAVVIGVDGALGASAG